MIVQGKDIKGPVRESADVCIIGSGCGGGASAKVLAESGKKVILLEEGGYYSAKEFDGTEQTAYTRLYQQRAGQATDDLSVTVLQGRCVGGSSTVNWTTSLRTPDFVLGAWKQNHGVQGLSPKELEPYFERVERYLNIHEEPFENHNPNNRIILDGAKQLGYRSRAVGRNTQDCRKAGACGLGCPFDAKKTVAITYVPDAAAAGATVFANFRANNIEVRGTSKRVTGVVFDEQTQRVKTDFAIEVPVVIVAGSAINSPVLLLKSNLANSSGEVGRNLTFHLTSAVLGLYEKIMYGAGGIPQSAMCDEFLNKNGDGGGFWLEAVPIYPVLAGLALPGFGSMHREMMRSYPHIGATIILVKEIESSGRVTVNDEGRASISYSLRGKDLEYLKQGLDIAARVQFAAGARRVMTLHARPTEFLSAGDITKKLAAAEWGTNEIAMYSAHPLGTCRMGSDPKRSVVDSHCQSHDVKGLFVIDGSVMPTSLGVNPQVTILAIAEKSAEWLANHFDQFRSS
ncbi:MAG: GMC family oxidoreductase [Ignavibacteriales bacterium]|nr:GMC family oxidoreductase [Ignavibacteriales bacterium]